MSSAQASLSTLRPPLGLEVVQGREEVAQLQLAGRAVGVRDLVAAEELDGAGVGREGLRVLLRLEGEVAGVALLVRSCMFL